MHHSLFASHLSPGTVRWSLILTVLLFAPAAIAQTVVPPSAGDGLTTATAYQLTELGNLVWLGEQAIANQTAGKYYMMMNDIDASVTATWNDDGTTADTLEGFRPIGVMNDYARIYNVFGGIFDGNGHDIVGLTINRQDEDHVGLFGAIAAPGSISNLGLRGGAVSGAWRSVGDTSAGGLVGVLFSGTAVTNCHTTASVRSGAGSVGGLVGHNQGGIVRRCYAGGAVSDQGPRWRPAYIGGLIGDNTGMVGDNWKTVADCYATGPVTGHAGTGTETSHTFPPVITGFAIPCSVGGLVGVSGGRPVTRCYATGRVVGVPVVIAGVTLGARTGGLMVGASDVTAVTACYWDAETTSQTTSAGGTGKTTAEMKQQATFVGWDFWAVWGMAADFNDGYPYLRIPGGPYGTPNKPANPRPPDGATGLAVDVALGWQDGGGATIYDVYLGTANPPVTRVATAQTETSYSPPSSLGYGTTYFWRIDAKNAAGTTAGDVWRFTTVPAPKVPGHFLSRRVKSSHSEKWDGKGARIVAKDAYSFSAKMQLPAASLASLSNTTTLTLVLGDAVTSGAACVVIERPLSAATKSTLAGHPTAKKPKDPTRGGSVTFVELQPNSKKKARVVTIKWTKTGVLTATVVGAPALANWDPADPAQRREVENIADLCDGAEWPEGVATGVAVPTLVDLSGVFIGADTVACGGKKSVKSSDGGDLVGWNVSGK